MGGVGHLKQRKGVALKAEIIFMKRRNDLRSKSLEEYAREWTRGQKYSKCTKDEHSIKTKQVG